MLQDTYQLLGPNSPTVLCATEQFGQDNPKTYQALIAALAEAAEFAQKNQGAAADTCIGVNGAKISREDLLQLIDNERFEFSVTPTNTYPLADSCILSARLRTSRRPGGDYFF